jgi:hypothetical protein
MSKAVNLKPYRLALEALISHQTESKMSALLGSAAANLDDPWLRERLKDFIDSMDFDPISKGPKRLARMIKYNSPLRRENPDLLVAQLIEYIEEIIDSAESAWEILARDYGWTPPDP